MSGKIIETPEGVRAIIVEQKGYDIYRGRHRSVDEAIEANEARLGIDQTLHMMAQRHNISVVLVVIPDIFKLFIASMDDFVDPELSISRPSFRGRATKMIPLTRFHQKYLYPDLKRSAKRAKTA